MFLALLFVWIPGIITTEQAVHGFSNDGMLTVGALFVVVESTRRSHVVTRIAKNVFGLDTSFRSGLLRMCIACYCLSAFLNNTPASQKNSLCKCVVAQPTHPHDDLWISQWRIMPLITLFLYIYMV